MIQFKLIINFVIMFNVVNNCLLEEFKDLIFVLC